MSTAISEVFATPDRRAPLAAVDDGPAASLPKHPGGRVYSPPAICCPASSHGHSAPAWQVRETEGEYVIPDLLADRNYEPDPALYDAAYAHTDGQRAAMALLDDAENLLGVLLAAIEPEGDSRATQTEAVLKIVKKKLKKAHGRIDRQDARHRNLFLAYFELKAQSGNEVQ